MNKLRTKFELMYSRLASLLPIATTFVVFTEIIVCCYDREYDYWIKVERDYLQFPADDSRTESVKISTYGKWFVSEVAPYVMVTPHEGYGLGDSSWLMVRMAEPNTSPESRFSVIVIKSFEEPNYSDTITVIQEGNYDYTHW